MSPKHEMKHRISGHEIAGHETTPEVSNNCG